MSSGRPSESAVCTVMAAGSMPRAGYRAPSWSDARLAAPTGSAGGDCEGPWGLSMLKSDARPRARWKLTAPVRDRYCGSQLGVAETSDSIDSQRVLSLGQEAGPCGIEVDTVGPDREGERLPLLSAFEDG